jgi:hypothetical protein
VSGPTVAGCVAIWNGEANAEVRAAAAAMHPREVFVGIVQGTGGIVAGPPPPLCAVFFRDPGGEGVPPSMLTITTTADGARFDLAGARRYEGADNTSPGPAPEAVLAEDGTLSLLHPPQPFPKERGE